jgi:prophage DNA circulation protein
MPNFNALLRQASFRGIPFHLEEDRKSFPRRIVTHEAPGRDEASQENLGKAPRVFSLTAYIIGPTFIGDAAALEAALDQEGPGALVHPHYGEVLVIVKNPERAHAFESLGQVIFTFDCEIYGAPQFPNAGSDTAGALLTAAANLYGALQTEFTSHFTTNLIPAYIAADSLGRIGSFIGSLTSLLSQGGLLSLLGITFPVFGGLDSTTGSKAVSLFQSIGAAAQSPIAPVIGDTPAPTLTSANVSSLIKIMSNIAATSYADTETPETTEASTRQQNAEAIDNLFRGCAVAAIATAARYADYESREEALAIRSQAAQAISALRDQYGADQWDASWIAAGQVLAALSRDINDRIGRLPRTVPIKLPAVRTSLDLAQRLYGDNPAVIFAQAEDISTRNKIRHPGFVPPQELEVLIA